MLLNCICLSSLLSVSTSGIAIASGTLGLNTTDSALLLSPLHWPVQIQPLAKLSPVFPVFPASTLPQNCHDLKNFEGLFALMRGLKDNCHEGTDGWLSVSSQLVSMYYNLCEVVSADMDHLRYRQELRMVNQSACVPILREFL